MTTEIRLLAFSKDQHELKEFAVYLSELLKKNNAKITVKVGEIKQSTTYNDFQCWININIPSESQAVESISEAVKR